MKIERSIAVYEKEEDSLIIDIVIDLSVDFLINLFKVDKNDDPDFHKGYLIHEEQYHQLKDLVPQLSKFDFDTVKMYLECFSLD
jgi:hypothetical protein